jgi:hypothetical protein
MPGLTGAKEMLEGPAGTGKTWAIGTCVDWCEKNGIEVFVLFAEQGLETLMKYYTDKKRPVPANLHWHVLEVKSLTLQQQMDASKNIAILGQDGLAKISDSSRHLNNSFYKLLEALSNFADDRTGKKFGPVDSWGPDKFLWLDGLSELTFIITKSTVGSKPTMSPAEYGLVQNQTMNILHSLTQACKCHFGLIAHVSREKDEITGGIKLMTRAAGQAISGDIPPLFSDVIYTIREGATFYWDTASASVDVKTRNLPISSKLAPDFAQVMEKWKANAAAAAPLPPEPR